ncbi:tetratricopeptide repeat protein [Desulfovibrio sp. OttesenSCG-928-M16]|nr:tetratricopeptide repeat protein [Desulfovibrio sp. OttesenSCG-928-M16]
MKRIVTLFCLFCLLLHTAACTSMEEKRDALMEQARAHEQKGNCAEASLAANQALELDPALPDALLILGRCDLKAEKNKEAAGHYSRVLELEPDSIEALLALTRLALLNNDKEKAAPYAQKAWELGERSRELTVLRAGVFMSQKDFASAKPLLEEATASDPTDEEAFIGLVSVYLNTDESAKAKEMLQDGLKRFPQSPAVLNLLLNLALHEEDWPLADDSLKRLRTLNPDNEELVLQQADIMIRSGKDAEIKDFLSDFLQKHPTALQVRMTLINYVSSTQGQFDEALKLMDEAPEQDRAVLRLGKANILASAGRVDECLALLKEIIREPVNDSQVLEAHMGLAEIYLQQERFDEALKSLDEVIKITPDNAAARMMRGRVHLSQRSLPEAIADFEAIVNKNQNNHAAMLGLADAQFVSGNAQLAENIVTGVIQRAPGLGRGYLSLANLYLMQQKPEAALMTLRLGKVAAPDDISIAFAEADLLTNIERYGEAEKLLSDLAKNKNFAEAALFRLAAVHGAAKDHKKAAAAYAKILDLQPEAQMAAEGHVRALIAAKQEKAALTFAEKRQKARPQDAAAAYLCGEAALAAKDLPRAEKAYLKAIELAPNWDKPLMTMSQIYSATKRLDKAIALCRDTMKKAPDASTPGMILAMLHEQNNDLRSAEEVYRNVLIKHPDLLPAANNLAFLISRSKATPERLAEAEELAQKAVKSGQPSTIDTLGWIQHLRGNNSDAEKNLRNAHQGAPDNLFIAYHLAVALGAQDEAEKHAEARELLGPLVTKKSTFPLKKEAEALLKKLGPKK